MCLCTCTKLRSLSFLYQRHRWWRTWRFYDACILFETRGEVYQWTAAVEAQSLNNIKSHVMAFKTWHSEQKIPPNYSNNTLIAGVCLSYGCKLVKRWFTFRLKHGLNSCRDENLFYNRSSQCQHCSYWYTNGQEDFFDTGNLLTA